MNCSSPIVDSGARRAPAANSTSGIVVAMPVLASSSPCHGARVAERPAPGHLQPDQHAQGDRREDRRLGRQAGQRLDLAADLVLDQPVGAEARRQDQRDPRRMAVVDGEHQRRPRSPTPTATHCSRRSRSRRTSDAEQHGEQRVDEVAERRLDHVAVVDGVDVDAPVDRDQHRGQAQRGEQARRPQHGGEAAQVLGDGAGRAGRRPATRAPGAAGSRPRWPARGPGSRAGTTPRPGRPGRRTPCPSRPPSARDRRWSPAHASTVQVSCPASSWARSASVAGPPARSWASSTWDAHQIVVRRSADLAEDADRHPGQRGVVEPGQGELLRRVLVVGVVPQHLAGVDGTRWYDVDPAIRAPDQHLGVADRDRLAVRAGGSAGRRTASRSLRTSNGPSLKIGQFW